MSSSSSPWWKEYDGVDAKRVRVLQEIEGLKPETDEKMLGFIILVLEKQKLNEKKE